MGKTKKANKFEHVNSKKVNFIAKDYAKIVICTATTLARENWQKQKKCEKYLRKWKRKRIKITAMIPVVLNHNHNHNLNHK